MYNILLSDIFFRNYYVYKSLNDLKDYNKHGFTAPILVYVCHAKTCYLLLFLSCAQVFINILCDICHDDKDT